MKDPIWVIGNPAAGSGRGAKVLAKVVEATASRSDVVVHKTRGPGDETKLAQQAISEGARALVAVGGDGTWSKVAAALLQSERRPPLALIAAGTGNDFAKTVGAPARDIARTLELLDAGATRQVDVGTVEDRYFLVCCGFGFDTAVLKRMESMRGLRGSARYLFAALRELSAYDGFDVSIADEDTTSHPAIQSRRLLMLVIANARHYGGAFKIAPRALLTDGLLDVIAVKPLPTMRRLSLLLSATRGAHIASPAVVDTRSSELDLRFPAPPLYNLDGDLVQARSNSVRVKCLPAALTVVARRGRA